MREEVPRHPNRNGQATSILFGGDVYIDRPSPGGALQELRHLVQPGELFFANLEGPLTDIEMPIRYKAGYSAKGFRSSPNTAKELTLFNAMSIANNHTMDFGPDALIETIANLEQNGIGHVGGGSNLDEANAPLVLTDTSGISVGLLAYTCLHQRGFEASQSDAGLATIRVHTAYEPPDRVLDQPGLPPKIRTMCDADSLVIVTQQIEELASTTDLVVVSFHWGVSGGNREIAEYQRELAHRCIDAGALVVFGHHTHLVGPIEGYRGGVVLYSLGDLVFDHSLKYAEPVTAIIRCRIEGHTVVAVGVVPLRRNSSGSPTQATLEESEPFVERLVDRCTNVWPMGWEGGEYQLLLAPRSNQASD